MPAALSLCSAPWNEGKMIGFGHFDCRKIDQLFLFFVFYCSKLYKNKYNVLKSLIAAHFMVSFYSTVNLTHFIANEVDW